MSTIVDTRSICPPFGSTSDRTKAPRPNDASRIEFEHLAAAYFRSAHRNRLELANRLHSAVEMSREPRKLVNSLVELSINCGGPDGLELAADVLAKVPNHLLHSIKSFLRNDAPRRRDDRELGYPQSTIADSAWYVLLTALSKSAVDRVDQRLILMHAASEATDGMTPAVIAAATEYGRHEPDGQRFARRILDQLSKCPLSDQNRRYVLEAIDDLA